jgi:class 3 adenylate cyclase
MKRGLSLRAKWTLALLVVGAAPLLLLGYATVAIQRRGLEDAERQLEVSIIDHVGSALDRGLDDAAEGTHRVGRMLTEPRITSDDARLELAREAMARAGVLAEVAIYAPNGTLIDAIRRVGAPPRPPPAKSFDAAGKREGRWLPVEYGGGSASLRYAEAAVQNGAVRAWVVGTIDAEALTGILQAISRDRFDDRRDGVLLTDEGARILAGGAGESLAVGATLTGRDLLRGQMLPPDPFSRPFALATEFEAESGEAMVGSLRSLPSRRWAVAVRRPRAAAYGALASAQRLLGTASAALLLAAIALGAFLAARTTRPIHDLVRLTRAYAKRAFAERSTVHTGDELEELGTSMTEMADAIAASEVEITRRAAVESNLSRYLPGEVAKSIADGKQGLSLGGERRQITVVFADVVAFTNFAEGAPPERVVAFLNELFSVLTEVVFRHGGTVDKFMGDCLMAFFGAPNAQDDHAARALLAAEDMHRFAEANAPAWKETYGVEVKLGIGVNSGDVLVGNLGSEKRMEYTAIGDVVNIAARLEGLARPGQTLLTSEVARAAGEDFPTQSLGEHPLRGKRQAVEVLELQ